MERVSSELSVSAIQRARVLLCSHDFPRAWEVARGDGEEVARAFWTHFRTYGLGHDFSHVEHVARQLIGVGRRAAALHFILLYARRLDKKEELVVLVAEALEGYCQLERSSRF